MCSVNACSPTLGAEDMLISSPNSALHGLGAVLRSGVKTLSVWDGQPRHKLILCMSVCSVSSVVVDSLRPHGL